MTSNLKLKLIKVINIQEIRKGLKSIADNKTLGKDGYSVFFFKIDTPITGKKVEDIVLEIHYKLKFKFSSRSTREVVNN